MKEEEQHSAMFHDLNQKCVPMIYRLRKFHFIQYFGSRCEYSGLCLKKADVVPISAMRSA